MPELERTTITQGELDVPPEETVRQSTPPHVPSTTVEAGQRLDDFDLLAKVGEGSFAQVYLARQVSMQRLVALKVSADKGAEPQTLAQLDHPHIVRVYDQRLLPERGLRLLYMPYLAGGTLRDVLKLVQATPLAERSGKLILQAVDANLDRRGVIPPSDSMNRVKIAAFTWPEAICWLGARLAEALAYAHKQGVLHRDLKPANVLLGSDASPRLADFNVSSSTGVENVEEVFGGSLAYMSPEQLEAFDPARGRSIESLDGRSDLYSLGLTLWELLTGESAFKNNGGGLDLDGMLEERAAGLKSTPSIPLLPGMLEVLQKCLAAKAEDRFENAAEVARHLDLCRMPRSRELLLPKPGWRTWIARHPVIALYTVCLLPNIIAAVLSIEYNRTALVDHYPAARDTFKLLQLIVNGTFFPACMALYAMFIWPVIRGLRSPQESPLLRRQCLRLGPISVAVVLWAWVAAGVIFPLAMHFAVHELPLHFHLHFLASQTLCGLIAVTYPQFGVSMIALRCFYPKFVGSSSLTPDDRAQLHRLDRAQGFYLWLAASIPMLGIALLVGFAAETRAVLGVLCAIGLAGFVLASVLTTMIRSDRAALEATE